MNLDNMVIFTRFFFEVIFEFTDLNWPFLNFLHFLDGFFGEFVGNFGSVRLI